MGSYIAVAQKNIVTLTCDCDAHTRAQSELDAIDKECALLQVPPNRNQVRENFCRTAHSVMLRAEAKAQVKQKTEYRKPQTLNPKP